MLSISEAAAVHEAMHVRGNDLVAAPGIRRWKSLSVCIPAIAGDNMVGLTSIGCELGLHLTVKDTSAG